MSYQNFEILVEKEPNDEGYYAYSPMLPGYFGCGWTIEEAQYSIHLVIQQLLAQGEIVSPGEGIGVPG